MTIKRVVARLQEKAAETDQLFNLNEEVTFRKKPAKVIRAYFYAGTWYYDLSIGYDDLRTRVPESELS